LDSSETARKVAHFPFSASLANNSKSATQSACSTDEGTHTSTLLLTPVGDVI
jgi:hypothetical protein